MVFFGSQVSKSKIVANIYALAIMSINPGKQSGAAMQSCRGINQSGYYDDIKRETSLRLGYPGPLPT